MRRKLGNGHAPPMESITHNSLFTVLLVAIMAVFALPEKTMGQVSQGWDIFTPDSLRYLIYREMDWGSDQYNEFDTVTFDVIMNPGAVRMRKISSFYADTSEYGPYFMVQSGEFYRDPSDTVARPFEGEQLLHVLEYDSPMPGVSEWTTYFPSFAEINNEDTLLALQFRTDYELLGIRIEGNDTLSDFAAKGHMRLQHNSGTDLLVGDESTWDIDFWEVMDGLAQFNQFMFGTVTWSSEQRATVYAEFTYVGVPRIGGDSLSIANSNLRQHVTSVLEVQP